MGLEPVAGPAPIHSTGTPVAVENEPSQFGRDGPGGRPDGEGLTLGGGLEDFDLPVAEDLFEGQRSDPYSVVDLDAGFAVG